MSEGKHAPNNVRSLREQILLSKAELARKAGVSPVTVDRVENGADCRLDTKRKIILALGKKLEDRDLVFPRPAAAGDEREPVVVHASAPARVKKEG